MKAKGHITAELSLFMFTRWSLQKQSRVCKRTALCNSKNIKYNKYFTFFKIEKLKTP